MQITLGWPQLVYLVLFVFCLIGAVVRHGKYQPAKEENAYVVVVGLITQAALMYWGGFFG